MSGPQVFRIPDEPESPYSGRPFQQHRRHDISHLIAEKQLGGKWSSNSVVSEPANFYSSAGPAQEDRLSNSCLGIAGNISSASMFSAITITPKSSSLKHTFENSVDLNPQYLPPAPESKSYEEMNVSIVLTEQVQDETLYGSYAETDLDNLDETTDFSQKYQEHSDSYQNFGGQLNASETSENFRYPVEESPTAFSQDTVKVYCTEGTPIMVSSASSTADLRDVGASGNIADLKRESGCEPKECQHEEPEGEEFNGNNSIIRREKFSTSMEKEHDSPTVRETKMVSFVDEVNLAEETPLMFSRSSSLGSLSSFDQAGSQDNHGLASGHYSQQTSGNISPSDLPDSPSETMPPSPRHFSCRPIFRLPPCVCPLPPPVDSVFREVPQRFAEEDTPCRISQATSLSSLTIDDEPCINEASCIIEAQVKSEGVFSDAKHQFAEEGTPFQVSRAESLSPLPLHDGGGSGEQNAEQIAKYSTAGRNMNLMANRTPKQDCSYFDAQKCHDTVIGCNVAYDPSRDPTRNHIYQKMGRNVMVDNRRERIPVIVQTPLPSANGVPGRKLAKVLVHTSNHNDEFGDDDIFGDAKREFTEEGTPYQYSRRTSLSSLSFDDEAVSSAAHGPILEQVTCTNTWNSELPSSDMGDPRKHPNQNVTFSAAQLESSTFADETRVYCTEDTPANVSHAASYSDLSNVIPERSLHDRRNWGNSSDDDNTPGEFVLLGRSLTTKTGSNIVMHESGSESNVVKHTDVSGCGLQSPLDSPTHASPVEDNKATYRSQNGPNSCPKTVPLKSENSPEGESSLCGNARMTPSSEGHTELDAAFRNKFGSDGNICYEEASSGRNLASNRQSKSSAFLTNVDAPRFQVIPSVYSIQQLPGSCQKEAQHNDIKIMHRNVSDDDNTVYNASKHPISLPKTYPSDEDDEIDDSAIQAEIIRRGMPKSSSPVTFPVMPYITPKETTDEIPAHSPGGSDDEASDSQLLEQLIRLGKQQLCAPHSVPKGEGPESRTSRSRTKERPLLPSMLPSHKPPDCAVKSMQVSAPHSFSVPSKEDPQFQKALEYNRARFAGERSEQIEKLQKQNIVRYAQRSSSERRQKAVAVPRSDIEYASACDMPELYRRNEYRFTEDSLTHFNDFTARKPSNILTQCYASPMINRQLPSQKQVYQQFCKKSGVSGREISKNTVPLTDPVRNPSTRKPFTSPPSQMVQSIHSDSEDEEADMKRLRELILMGSPGLSDAMPKLPAIRDRARTPNCPATSPTKSDTQQNKPPTLCDDISEAMMHLAVSSTSDVPKRKSSPSKMSVTPKPSCIFLDCSTQTDDLDTLPVAVASTVVQVDTVPKICKDSTAETDAMSHGERAHENCTQNAVRPVDIPPGASFTIDSQCNKLGASRQSSMVKARQEKTNASSVSHDLEKPSISSNTYHCHDASQISGRIESRAYSHANNDQEGKKYDMPPEPPADSMERVTAIRIKLPNGRSLTRRFVATWELKVLLTFLESLGYPKEKFKILKNWRRQELSTSNPTQTLEQLKLYPRKTLTIKER